MIAALVAEALALFLDAGIAHGAASLPRGQVRVWSFITTFGTSGYMFAISALIAILAWTARRYANNADHRRRLTASMEGALFFFGCIAASGIGVQAIKHVVGRMRPRFLTEVGAFDFLGPTLHRGANSFPSGHTTSAFAAAMALGLIAPRLRVPLFVFAILIAVSRVATGNHFPSDILAGAALGVGVSWGGGDLACPPARAVPWARIGRLTPDTGVRTSAAAIASAIGTSQGIATRVPLATKATAVGRPCRWRHR